MTTSSSTSSLHEPLARKLHARQAELQAHLDAAFDVDAERAGVTDFKDLAAEEATVAVDDVGRALAARELDEVNAALQRLADGSYGECLDCGERIDQRRLAALPATPLCTPCQVRRESAAAAA
jgi:DnaK suppressor protein